MKLDDADPPYPSTELGTPLDYSEDVYRVYFEVSDPGAITRQLIVDFLGEARGAAIQVLDHGYEIELPIQVVPEIVRLLAVHDVAVYQVVRYAKTKRAWR